MNKIKKPLGIGYFLVVLSLPLLSAFFLYLEHVTHVEFLLHIAAIPLEILLGGILVEQYLGQREKKRRARQLMFLKSCLFRSEFRALYLANFGALAYPVIGMEDIKCASTKELNGWLNEVDNARYHSPEAIEAVLIEYVNAYPTFNRFLEWAIANDDERIFHDMIMLMHFIHDIQLFKSIHPDKLFINKAIGNQELMNKIIKTLTAGIKSFLRFSIELQENDPDLFLTMMDDYLCLAAMKSESRSSKPRNRLQADLAG